MTSTSQPASRSKPSSVSRMRCTASICRRTSSASRPMPMPTPPEWSVIAMYSCPRARTASTTSSSECLPSPLQSLCRWRSPRMSAELDELGQLVRARQLELAVVLAQLGRDRLVAEVAVDLVLVRRAEDLAALGVLDAPLRDAHAASLGVLAHAHVVALRAGEVLQEVAVALERHDAQVELHAVVGQDRRLRRAVAEHLGDERLLDQPGGQRRAVARGGDHVHVAHRLGAPPQRARLVGPLAGRVRAQRLEHGARELERLVEPEARLRGAAPASSWARSCCSLRSPKPA